MINSVKFEIELNISKILKKFRRGLMLERKGLCHNRVSCCGEVRLIFLSCHSKRKEFIHEHHSMELLRLTLCLPGHGVAPSDRGKEQSEDRLQGIRARASELRRLTRGRLEGLGGSEHGQPRHSSARGCQVRRIAGGRPIRKVSLGPASSEASRRKGHHESTRAPGCGG